MKRILLFCALSVGLLLCGCVGFYTDMSHLVVAAKETDNTSNPFFIHFLDDYMGDKYNAKSMYAFYIKSSSDSIRGVLKMEKLVEKDSIQWSVRLFNRYTKSWPYTHDFKADRNIYRGNNPVKVKSILKQYEICIFNL